MIALGSTAFIYGYSDQPAGLTGDVNGSYVYDASSNKKTDYVRAAGMSIARVVNGTPTYTHNDHLGSVAALTNSAGALSGPIEHFTPFGEALTPNAANDNQAAFTGHIRDKATGLTYMQARYNDPVIGRFLTFNPMLAEFK